LAACPYFTLELMMGGARPIAGDTAGQTFHALTVIEGAAEVVAQGGTLRPNRFDSAVIPAACGAYEIRPLDGCRVLRASAG
jgi:mannose-6-phosphate isomerase